MRIAPLPVLLLALLIVACSSGGPREVREFAADGSVLVEGQTVDGFQEGAWTYYRADGSKRAAGRWERDEREGPWQWWHADGGPAASGSYRRGLQEGTWITWHEPTADRTPRLASHGSYRHARQEGLWRYWDEGGALLAAGLYVDGTRTLAWRFAGGDCGLYWNGRKLGWWREGGALVDHGIPDGWRRRSADAAAPAARWQVDNGSTRLSITGLPGAAQLVSASAGGRSWLIAYAADGAVGLAGELLDGAPDGPWLIRLAQPAGTYAWLAGRSTTPAVRRDAAEALLAGLGAATDEDLPDPTAELLADSVRETWRSRTPEITRHLAVIPAEPVPAPPSAPIPAATPADAPEPSPLVDDPQPFTARDRMKLDAAVAAYGSDGVFAGAGYVSRKEAAAQQKPRFDADALGATWLGQELPQRRFLGQGGRVVDLDAFRGEKSVVLVILRGFSGSICPYCTAQTRALNARLAEFAAVGAEVVYLYPGSAASVPVFLRSVAELDASGKLPPLTVLLDIDLAFIRALGIAGELAKPTSIVIGADGRIGYAYVGQDLTDRPPVQRLLDEAREAAGRRP